MTIKFHLIVESQGAVAVGSSAVLGHWFVKLTNLILNCSLNGCWLDIVTSSACSAPINSNSQSISGQTGNPAVTKLIPTQLVRTKARISWNGLNDVFDTRQARPKWLRSNSARRKRCRKTTIVFNRPNFPTGCNISVKHCCL